MKFVIQAQAELFCYS